MNNRDALTVAITVLSGDIDDLIAAANAECRLETPDNSRVFDMCQTVCTMTLARTKLRMMLAKVERE